jgi:hypothetical protein
MTITAKANQSKKTFTIRKYEDGKLVSKFKTTPMNKEDFKDCEYNTELDWSNYLKIINMAISYQDKDIHFNGVNYFCEVEVEGVQVDESFSHAFGVHDPGYSVEITGVEIITVYDQNDKVITKRRIISALENLIDAGDFEDVEFDFSN